MRGTPSRKGDKMYELKEQVEAVMDKVQYVLDHSKKLTIITYVAGFICLVAMMYLGE